VYLFLADKNSVPLYEEITDLTNKQNAEFCVNANVAYGNLQTSNNIPLNENVCYESAQLKSNTEVNKISINSLSAYEEIH